MRGESQVPGPRPARTATTAKARTKPPRSVRQRVGALGLLVAVVGVLVSGFGIWVAHDDALRSALGGRPVISVSPVYVTVTPSPTGASTGSASPTAVTSGVYHEGPLTLFFDQAEADLDAAPSDAQWETVDPSRTAVTDLAWTNSGLEPESGNGVRIGRIATDAPVEKSVCVDAHAYESDALAPDTVKAGTTACLFTSEKRYAIVRVVGVAHDGGRISLRIYTFR